MATNLWCIPRKKGVYILVIEVGNDIVKRVGSLGRVWFKRGTYFYVGSALGTGGLYSRVRRHFIKDKRPRWHIDYLTMEPSVHIRYVAYVLYSEYPGDIESEISRILSKSFEITIKKFGSTDKKDKSHLFWCRYNISYCLRFLRELLENYGITLHICHATDLNTT